MDDGAGLRSDVRPRHRRAAQQQCLASLLGLTAGDTSLEGDVGVTGPSSAVVAVAAWYAPSDLVGFVVDSGGDPDDATTREALLLGGTAVSPAVRPSSDARWPPADSPQAAIRSGSTPRSPARARSQRTAAFASCSCAGQTASPESR